MEGFGIIIIDKAGKAEISNNLKIASILISLYKNVEFIGNIGNTKPKKIKSIKPRI